MRFSGSPNTHMSLVTAASLVMSLPLKTPRRPCMNYQIGKCLAPCAGLVSESDYRAILDRVIAFLSGDSRELIRQLEKEMLDASMRMEYEQAAIIRDKIADIKQLMEEQHAIQTRDVEQDILAVAVDGIAYLFTAKCGTGKSTHTRLYREVFGPRARMVNDDKPFLRFTEHGVLACGAPWSGKHGLDSNVQLPLKGICILQRGQENHIRQITMDAARPMLLKQACAPWEGQRQEELSRLVERLGKNVRLWQMDCNKESQAAVIAHTAMGKE